MEGSLPSICNQLKNNDKLPAANFLTDETVLLVASSNLTSRTEASSGFTKICSLVSDTFKFIMDFLEKISGTVCTVAKVSSAAVAFASDLRL